MLPVVNSVERSAVDDGNLRFNDKDPLRRVLGVVVFVGLCLATLPYSTRTFVRCTG